MNILITQSNYIPWKGYFDSINKADVLVLYDDVQFTKRDWRNRNKIKTPQGVQWLTIPVEVKGKYLQRINEVEVSERTWNTSHWSTLIHNYSKAPYFREFKAFFEELYLDCTEQQLSMINYRFISAINKLLAIQTKICWSHDLKREGDRSERLLSICQQLGGTNYLSGPAAKAYLDVDLFTRNGVGVEWLDYSGYPPYHQLHGDFVHEVSVVDLIFNVGENAKQYMKSFN